MYGGSKWKGNKVPLYSWHFFQKYFKKQNQKTILLEKKEIKRLIKVVIYDIFHKEV